MESTHRKQHESASGENRDNGSETSLNECPSYVDKQAYHLYIDLADFSATFPPLQKAMRTLDSAFRLYTPDNVAVAFNGGKDATVVMHLARASMANWCKQNMTPAKLHCLYMLGTREEQFSEVTAFVHEQVSAYDLAAVEVPLGIKEGICEFIRGRTATCAFVLGTRRSDPHGATMEHFEPSSKGWPCLMRVSPILTWRYHHVWEFLRHFRIPYCCLYDKGYTSLGSVPTTKPNPALREGEDGIERYKPAWKLEDESLERAGRLPRP